MPEVLVLPSRKNRLRSCRFCGIIHTESEVTPVNDIERIVKEVHSSMAMEGLPLTSADKDRIRKCLTDPGCLDSVIRALLVKHSAVVRAGN